MSGLSRPQSALVLALAVGWSLPAQAQVPAPVVVPAPAPVVVQPAPAPVVVQPAPAPVVVQPAPAQPPIPGDTITEVDPVDVPSDQDPLRHAWDEPSDRGGFYLRATATIGAQSTHLGAAPWDSNNSRLAHGFGTGFTLDLGGFLASWVALHIDTMVGVLWNGSLDYEYALAGYESEEARVVAYGLAPAVTFFTPRSFYIKTAFGLGIASVDKSGPDNLTKPGFYTDMALGKDLYVDRHVALGLQFQIAYMLLGDKNEEERARVRQYLVGLSMAFDGI